MRELKRAASERIALGREAQGETSRRKKVRLFAWAADRRPDRFTLLAAAAAALGAGLVLLRVAGYGPLVWWDAVYYITVARNLLAGDGFVGLGGVPLTTQPPLYPALLAGGGGLFGLDPYAVAGPLNAVLFGLTVLVAGWWLRRRLRSRFLWLWGCFSIALALPLADVASQALSESAFILFVTLALTQIDVHLGGGGRASLMRAAACGAAACLTRYMGVSVILTVIPLLLAARVAPREKVKRIAVYTLLAAAPLGLWMLRNFLLVGFTTGERGRGFYSLPFIVDEALRIAVGDGWLVGLTVPVLLALASAAGYALHRRSQRKSGAPVAAEVARGPLRVCGGFAFAYLMLLAAALMSGGAWDGLPERFLAPVYIPLLFAALLLLDGALRHARKTLAAVLMLALPLQAAWLVVLHKREIPLWNAGERQGYGAPRWRDSESVRYIREAALTGAILSNVHLPPSLHAPGPARRYELLCEPDHLRWALSNAPGGGDVHVLYFSDWDYWNPCPRQQDDDFRSALSREPWLELVAEPADGKLYRLIEPEFRPAARFRSADAPVVGRWVGAVFNESRGRRLPGEPWRWEKGGDAAGWTRLPVEQSAGWTRPPVEQSAGWYAPTVADVGQRLRASVYYADRLGNRVKAITEPSEPVQAGVSEADRIIRSEYDVYLRGNKLTYENRSCIWEDEYGTRFPLTVYSPASESGTLEHDTLDFEWRTNFWKGNGICVTERRLPDKEIFGIRTGQVDRGGNLLWEAEHMFAEKRRLFDDYWSAATSGEPAVRSDFDVYLSENELIYVKEPCARADTEAKFFLALFPADANDLPGRRRQHGFDNLDFDFDERGVIFDGRCTARIPLPEYAITRIGTGQYVPAGDGFHNLWEAEFRLEQ